MKVNELIKQLQKLERQYDNVSVSVYGCCGYEDNYPVEELEQTQFQFSSGETLLHTSLIISVGCATHKQKWNCEKYPQTFKRKLANLLVRISEWILK